MAIRVALPIEAVTITPGYSWRLDLDVMFDGERPDDWPNWTVRALIWGDTASLKLTPGNGISFEAVPEIEGAPIIPIIRLSADQTDGLRGCQALQYIIDLAPEGEDPVDYFAGPMAVNFGAPVGMAR